MSLPDSTWDPLWRASKSGPGEHFFSICRALFLQLSGDFFPRSAALILGPQTGPSFKGPCRRGPNSGPISRDSGGDPRNSTFLHGWLTPTAKQRATCNVAVVALLARADILSRALCLMSDGSCLPPGASCLLSPFRARTRDRRQGGASDQTREV